MDALFVGLRFRVDRRLDEPGFSIRSLKLGFFFGFGCVGLFED
ncbi:MAG: hypothetical protein WCI02_07775 [Planctomycetota bacterium]